MSGISCEPHVSKQERPPWRRSCSQEVPRPAGRLDVQIYLQKHYVSAGLLRSKEGGSQKGSRFRVWLHVYCQVDIGGAGRLRQKSCEALTIEKGEPCRAGGSENLEVDHREVDTV